MLLLTLTLEQEEYRSSGVQEFRSSGVQEFRRKEEFWRALRLLRTYFGRTQLRSDLTGEQGSQSPTREEF
jgi:hypothetical protein